jgi:DNA-binding GntR family transcriptional regulator
MREVAVGVDDQQVPPRGPQRPYEIVAADLRTRIAANEWQQDEALPTVGALAEYYEVSRATITRTLQVLAGEGLIRVVPRWGTFRT